MVEKGTDKLEFQSPRGIFIGKRFGQVFTTDLTGGQYYWLGTDGYIIGCFPSTITTDTTGSMIALYLTELSEVKIDIYDSTNTIIRTLTQEPYQPPGQAMINWDGKNMSGNYVGPGEYTIHAYLYPTYGATRRSFKKELETKIRKT